MDVTNKSKDFGGHALRIVVRIALFLVLLLEGGMKAATIKGDCGGTSCIFFTNPTPANDAILAQNYTYINTTVSSASTAFIDWNRSLVGWWRFNNENGENPAFFKDWSSWGNNATCSGTNCPASMSGKFGKALDFDGVNDYVDGGNEESLNLTGNITVEAWIKPEILETAYIVKKATGDSTDGYELSLGKETGKAFFRVNQLTSGNTYKLFSTSSYPVDGNTWVHLVGLYNRDQLQIYFNGNLENSMPGPTNILFNTDNLKIGGSDDSRYFNGTIDEVRIWNRALGHEEINGSYNADIYRLYNNFTNQANGEYNYRAYVQNLQGCVNQTEKRTLSLIPANNGEKIKVASFNLKSFGISKTVKPEVMYVLSNIIRNFDVVALQEIRDASQTALPALMDAVNSNGITQYDYVASERLGRKNIKMQYAYLYNIQTIELIGNPYVFPDSEDLFEREPFVANFKTINGNFDFVSINIHALPNNATQEINDLPKVVEDARSRYQGEGDFIVIGDPNADCNYFDENSNSTLKSSDYFWVINNSIDTSTKAINCTYDRIILTSQAKTDFTGNSGAFMFDEAYNLTYNMTKSVSDHYPVYAEFWSNKDTD